MRDLAQNSSKPVQKGVPEWPLGGVLGPPRPPDPLLGHRLLAISSVILAPRGPGGVIQGSKRGQNGSFWGSQNDPSDEWFWPFSPPKPGQEGSKRGSKMGHFGPLQTPSRPPQGPFKGAEILLLAISSVILAPRGPGGVIQGSKMTPFWTPF